jgi:hypothetical protein
MIITSNVCTIHSNRVVGSFKTMAHMKQKDDPSVQAQQKTQNLEQHHHVRNGTRANMVGSDTPTDTNQENETPNVTTNYMPESCRRGGSSVVDDRRSPFSGGGHLQHGDSSSRGHKKRFSQKHWHGHDWHRRDQHRRDRSERDHQNTTSLRG